MLIGRVGFIPVAAAPWFQSGPGPHASRRAVCRTKRPAHAEAIDDPPTQRFPARYEIPSH